jgi:hypothetical protein
VRRAAAAPAARFSRKIGRGTRVAETGRMDRTLPHFLRVTRALAFVSGVAFVPACGGAVEGDGQGKCESPPYDGCWMGSPTIYDGGSTGIDAPFNAYDGGPMGTPPYNGIDAGIVAYDGGPMGTAPYDGSAAGIDAAPPHDGSADGDVDVADAGLADAPSDVLQGGGPLAPPDLPA